REVMEARGIDAAVVFNFENQFYYSGLRAITYSRPIILIVERHRQSLIIPSLEENHAKEKTDVDHLFVYHEVAGKNDGSTDYRELFDEVLSKLEPGATVGIEYGALPADYMMRIQDQGLPVEDIGGDITRLRAIKSEAEIEMISESGKLVSGALRRTIEHSAVGRSELEIDVYCTQVLFDDLSTPLTVSTLDYIDPSPSGFTRTNMPYVLSNSRNLAAGALFFQGRAEGLLGHRAECDRNFFVGESS